jgi:hypothetical protein
MKYPLLCLTLLILPLLVHAANQSSKPVNNETIDPEALDNPFKYVDTFTEGNFWYYRSVFQNPANLAELMGGPKAMNSLSFEI